MRALCQEEVFGPVLALLPWSDEADLIAQCNDSVFGLACWHLDARLQNRLAFGPGAGDRHGLDQHLQAVFGEHAVWRRQAQRHRP